MRLIPEYEPVGKLYLSFVHSFFNTRFGYGRTICEMAEAASPGVNVEVSVGAADQEWWQAEVARNLPGHVRIATNPDSPNRGTVTEYVPIWAMTDGGRGVGLVFRQPHLGDRDALRQFAERFARNVGATPLDIGFDFTTAGLVVNEEVVLLSSHWFQGEASAASYGWFTSSFPQQSFYVVPSLAGDVTNDLDMCLWPIAPRAWIASEYPEGCPQAESMRPALQILREHGHTVHRVPGLEPIVYDDINTMPNYANGVLLNRTALVPIYGRTEDDVVIGILRDYGFEVCPIDCRQIILSNSGLHCISKTVPRTVLQPPDS